jgi:Hint domain/Subtilase family
MTIRIWQGGTGDWYAASLWRSTSVTTGAPVGGAPSAGDTMQINSGTVDLSGTEEWATGVPVLSEQITMGDAAVVATNAEFGAGVTLITNALDANSILDVQGSLGFDGMLQADAPSGSFTIDADPGSTFVLLPGGSVVTGSTDDFVLGGSMVTEADVTIDDDATFTNNGIDRIYGGLTDIQPGATLAGTGTFVAGPNGTLKLEVPVPATQTIAFAEAGRLDLTAASTFDGQIESFLLSDTIDLLDSIANYASYNATTGQLIVEDNGTLVAALAVQGPSTSMMLETSIDTSGTGTVIEYPGSGYRPGYEIDLGAQAVGANTVTATETTAAGAPINGAGITIGIISDSFNVTVNGVVDPADAATALGFLPQTGSGASAVTILQDGSAGDSDEGLAMAEMVHAIAPGAVIEFYAAGNGQDSFAQGVTALVQSGANIIVDDIGFYDAPFFQVAGPAATAADDAIASGVDYFTAASNEGEAYYQSAWQPVTADLSLGVAGTQSVQTQQFTGGGTLQAITIQANQQAVIFLQWDAPWPSAGGSVSDPLSMVLYNEVGDPVAESTQVSAPRDGYGLIPEISLTVPLASATTQYELAIYQSGPGSFTQFKYILAGVPSGSSASTSDAYVQSEAPGGTIDDPLAGQGSGDVFGQALVPTVNTVGAAYYAQSPAFGVPAGWVEGFSSIGPGTLLFDQDGNPLASPESAGKVDFVAPDGLPTSLAGLTPFFGTSAAAPQAAAVAALMLQANPNLTTAQVSNLLAQSALSMNLPAAYQGAGLIQATAAVALAQAAAQCYRAGTRIMTDRGPVAIEALHVGDTVTAHFAGNRRIVWIGRRTVDCRHHPEPTKVWPIRIRAHAFGKGMPDRDLFVSPDHGIYAGDSLIPARLLADGDAISQVPVEQVTYYHVELPRHDLLVAEGLLAESYLDTGDRSDFDNSDDVIRLFRPQADTAALWDAGGCAPLVLGGDRLDKGRTLVSSVRTVPAMQRA